MNLYIAGSSLEKDLIKTLMDSLRHEGIKITVDWTVYDTGKDATLDRSIRYKAAMEDFSGIDFADIVWLVCPELSTRGAWIEFGYAIRSRIPVIVSGNWKQSIFTEAANVRFDTHNEALNHLIYLHKKKIVFVS